MRARRVDKPIPLEFQEQIAVIDWWKVFAPTIGQDERILFSVPNGSVLAGDARARARQISKLKATGMRPGMLDLMLALPTHCFPGMFIELKRRQGGVTSPEQVVMVSILRRAGYNVIVARGADEAIKAIKAYATSGLERRERVA